MATSSQNARKCCSMEKQRLVKELKKCDMCSGNYQEFHQCYRDAAKESGQRAKSCVAG